MRPDSRWSFALPAAALAVIAAAIGYAVVAHGRVPDGPSPVVYDRAACAACRMHVGEPAFAAQAQLADGQTLVFDDPGCLLQLLPQIEAEVRALWFHHVREDRWLKGDAVAFVAASPSPMGYEIGAVDPGTPGAVSLAAARERVASGGSKDGRVPSGEGGR